MPQLFWDNGNAGKQARLNNMSTFRDAARSQYEQENYDPDLTSGECDDCGRKFKNCKCPDQSPVFADFACQVCNKTFNEEWSGSEELHKECPACRRRRVYRVTGWDNGDEILF